MSADEETKGNAEMKHSGTEAELKALIRSDIRFTAPEAVTPLTNKYEHVRSAEREVVKRCGFIILMAQRTLLKYTAHVRSGWCAVDP